MQTPTTAGNRSQAVSYRNLGAHGSSSNVFAASESSIDANNEGGGSSALVGTDYILNVSLRFAFIIGCITEVTSWSAGFYTSSRENETVEPGVHEARSFDNKKIKRL